MAIAYVNSPTSFADDGNAYTSQVTGSFNVSAGNLVVVGVWWVDGGVAVTSITDTAGNTYSATAAKTQNAGTGRSSQLWYAKNTTANAANIITVNLGSARRLAIVAAQYSGLDTTAPIDAAVGGQDDAGASSTLTSASFTTTQADELIVQFGNGSGTTVTVGSGYTSRATSGQRTLGDKIVSAIQTGVTSSMTMGGADYWSINAASFKMAGGGGGGAFTPNTRKLLLGVG